MNNIFENDLLMRAILEGGQEEVPARVWDAVADGLDKASKRKTVVLRWRRAAVGFVAAAAAVASVFVLTRQESADIVPAATDLIAVVEPVEITEEAHEAELLAYVPEVSRTQTSHPEYIVAEAAEVIAHEQSSVSVIETSKSEADQPVAAKSSEPVQDEEVTEYFPTVWEDETPARGLKTSLVLSGITGASGSQNNNSNNINKAPSVILSPDKTGIKEKNTSSTYGLPVSVGAGVKIEFTPKWSLGVGLNYTYLTRKFNGTYTHVNETGIVDNTVTSEIRNSQHYLGIPVNAYYNIVNSKHVNFYAYAGGAVEKCVYDKYNVLSQSIMHKETAKGVQLSANLGLGAEFMLGEHLGLYLDPSLRYYFDCEQPKSIRTAQPLMLGFEMGFRFRL